MFGTNVIENDQRVARKKKYFYLIPFSIKIIKETIDWFCKIKNI